MLKSKMPQKHRTRKRIHSPFLSVFGMCNLSKKSRQVLEVFVAAAFCVASAKDPLEGQYIDLEIGDWFLAEQSLQMKTTRKHPQAHKLYLLFSTPVLISRAMLSCR